MQTTTANEHSKKIGISVLASSIILFIAGVVLTYSFFRYYIDPDAVCYIAIAKRYAAGDYTRAINGMWSPLGIWAAAGFIKLGFAPLLASHIANAIACLCTIAVTFYLLRRFLAERFFATCFMIALPVFMLYAMYIQLFDDIWQMFFSLVYVGILISDNFLKTPLKWIACGLAGALAFFSKTYAFYFTILHVAVAMIIFAKAKGLQWQQLAKPAVTILATMLIALSPWVYVLHQKYGGWRLSTVGPIDISWSITGYKTFKPGITTLVPPAYPNSPCSMEDPWINEGHIYSVWDSPKYMLREAGRIVQASSQFVKAVNEMSPFVFVVLAASVLVVLFKKQQTVFGLNHKILLSAALIMPLGYFAMHFEARFIWLMAIATAVLASAWVPVIRRYIGNARGYYLACLLFAFSYVAYPVFGLKELFNKGKDLYDNAQAINKLELHGTFTSNDLTGRASVTALLTGMPYYTLEHPETDNRLLLADMRRYGVNYYLLYYNNVDEPSVSMHDENGRNFPEVSHGTVPGLKIYKIN